jgi:hypothetical protein
MEELKKQEINIENVVNKQENIESNSNNLNPATFEEIGKELNQIPEEVNRENNIIYTTTENVNNTRHELGLIGEENNIPSIESNKNKIISLGDKKVQLEKKLTEILKSDNSLKYEETINQIKKSKIEWANSNELARRLKLKGLEDGDILGVREWLINNATNAKVFILPRDKFKEVVGVLHEMTGEDSINQGSAFYLDGGNKDVPENFTNSVYMKEKIPIPPMPGQESVEGSAINVETLNHELGHATQDGLLDAEQFKNTWNPKFKEGAPDKEYVGSQVETDTRVRLMFNSLSDSFDPSKEVFGKKQLEVLREKQKEGTLTKGVKDLLEHYDDIELVKIANRTPAI